MPEKFTSFEHVVGKGLTPEHKEKILKNQEEMFEFQEFKDLEGKEREKTSEELEILDLLNQETNKLLKGFGLKEFNIPPKNIHVIKKKEWKELAGEVCGGTYRAAKQGLILKEQKSNIAFASRALHEIIHFKSYGSIQVEAEEDLNKLEEYRIGLTVYSRDGSEKAYFDNLNEALTEELAKRVINSLKDNPLFRKEVEETEKALKELLSEKDSKTGKPLIHEEIQNEVFFAQNKQVGENQFSGSWKYFGRIPERRALNTLIDKLLEKNKNKFKNRDEILDIFIKAMLSGNIIPLGRLIDGAFGRKTFSKIGELDANIEELGKFVEKL